MTVCGFFFFQKDNVGGNVDSEQEWREIGIWVSGESVRACCYITNDRLGEFGL